MLCIINLCMECQHKTVRFMCPLVTTHYWDPSFMPEDRYHLSSMCCIIVGCYFLFLGDNYYL